ncbi:hypothetical protein R1flu_020029 [Riccia fluitans]|uniref:Uncharacterized protein n=1 Tax=Riccia fluitans TaxID=41844 RepID=A0ABD1ZKC1_9MARC
MAVEAEQCTEAIRLEKEALQQQYTKEKIEWETKNTQLIEEVGQLHKEKKKNAMKEEDVQKELAQIHSLMEQATHNTGEAPKLKRELEAKQEELKRLQEVDKKIRQRLKVARRKGRELEDKLKTMPVCIVVSKTLELIRPPKELGREEVCDLVENRSYDSGIFAVSRVI